MTCGFKGVLKCTDPSLKNKCKIERSLQDERCKLQFGLSEWWKGKMNTVTPSTGL